MTLQQANASSYHDQARLCALSEAFSAKYSQPPACFVRVPGRVNLIGEHIDYCGYGVHPMAIEQDILVAVAVTKEQKKLRLANVQAKEYPDREIELEKPITIIPGEVDWSNYFLCGIKGVIEEFEIDGGSVTGMDCLMDGRIPSRVGLSSSSAVVVSAAMCTVWANGVKTSHSDLAELCAKSERFIGTQGGGMDQAIELLAHQGAAKLIEFNPLRTFDVFLPDGAVFVIANSLAESNKAAGSDYNARVAECRMATKVLAKKLGLDSWKTLLKLGDLQKSANVSPKDMADKVKEHLHEGLYTKEEVCSLLEVSLDWLSESCLNANTTHLDSFILRDRALHVYSEAARVHDFKDECHSKEASLNTLGKLMLDSHRSCQNLYECSHPQLDKLVQLSIKHGALGARLTGAGWGGCIVALVPKDKTQSFIDGLGVDYYDGMAAARGMKLTDLVFATKPGAGASIYVHS